MRCPDPNEARGVCNIGFSGLYPPGPGTESERDKKEIGRRSQSVVEKGGICVRLVDQRCRKGGGERKDAMRENWAVCMNECEQYAHSVK